MNYYPILLFLNLSHSSYSDSLSFWRKLVIWFLSWTVLLWGNYFDKNACDNCSHVVIESGGSEWSHARALSLIEKGNNLSLKASLETPFIFIVSQYSNKIIKCIFKSSSGDTSNWFCWIIKNMDGLISKLLVSIDGWAMLQCKPHRFGAVKSLNDLLASIFD